MKKIMTSLALVPLFAFAVVASAQTTTDTTASTTTTIPDTSTPTLPNTGNGGDASTNIALMLASGAVVLGGSVYLARKLREQA